MTAASAAYLNIAVEPTANSVRCAPAVGGGSPRVFVRQAKLGASGRVQVPAAEGLPTHSSRVLRL